MFVTTPDRVPVWVKVCKLRYNEEYGKQNGQKVEWRVGDKEDILIITGTETTDGRKDDEKILYVRHKKLSVSRQLYKRDGIHLDGITGTSLLVADVKRTIWSLENTHTGHNSETRNQHMRSQQGDNTPSSSQSRPRQDNIPQQYRDRGRPTRSWRSDNHTSGEWRRGPSASHEDIMNLAYKLKGLLNTL
ncbi:Hypp8732 [Branchiostoma lanceolatum]|uniref:Hypp8732 protein n=1 Tax=Branchiostoma lanceolatum TaxID=7740 RepID=A0A8K0EEG7_BRALA|nr:Hypp8732 [Branchiostoma lanceolatum]